MKFLNHSLSLFLVLAFVQPAQATLEISDGFLTNPDLAFARAKKEKKPLLIQFYGIWCPPCNEMKELVYSSAEFRKRSKNFVLLKQDADHVSSWPLKDRYNVGGYPTVVLANPDGKELYRVVGSRSAKEFFRIMQFVRDLKGRDVETACKRTDTESLWQCAFVCSERKETDCAKAAFAKLVGKLPEGSARYELAENFAAEAAETPELKRSAYERLLKAKPGSVSALSWAGTYWELSSEGQGAAPNKELLDKVLAEWPAQQKDPKALELGFADTDLLQMRADLLDKMGRKEESLAAWKEAAVAFEKKAALLPAGSPARGFTIERIYCLGASGDKASALKLANEYRAKFPTEFTFHYQAANLLEGEKKYPEALAAAKEAHNNSYGDNRIRAATLLVRLYGTVPDKASAEALVKATKAEIHPDEKLKVRTHRYLKKLDQALGG